MANKQQRGDVVYLVWGKELANTKLPHVERYFKTRKEAAEYVQQQDFTKKYYIIERELILDDA